MRNAKVNPRDGEERRRSERGEGKVANKQQTTDRQTERKKKRIKKGTFEKREKAQVQPCLYLYLTSWQFAQGYDLISRVCMILSILSVAAAQFSPDAQKYR